MDVRCGRCGTDYDFDDALLSSRGTMVRCTTCGHQFKVFPAHVAGAVTDRWLIEKTTGQQLVFTSLKDLQRAIGAGVVRRQDVLTRGGEVRQVGSIAELDSLFRKKQGPTHDPRTLLGIAPTSAGAGAGGSSGSEPAPFGASTEPAEDEITKVVTWVSEPTMPTPPVGMQIPDAARSAAPRPAKDAAETTRAARVQSPERVSAGQESEAEAVPTPRAPSWPPDAPTAAVTGSSGQVLAEPIRPVGYGRYAETLRSEESIVPITSSARPDRSSAARDGIDASGAKPIARIITERVAVRQQRPGESTLRSSEWAHDSGLSPEKPAPIGHAKPTAAPNDSVHVAGASPSESASAKAGALPEESVRAQTAKTGAITTNLASAQAPNAARAAEASAPAVAKPTAEPLEASTGGRARHQGPVDPEGPKNIEEPPRSKQAPRPAPVSSAKPKSRAERTAGTHKTASPRPHAQTRPVAAEPAARHPSQSKRPAAVRPQPRRTRIWIGALAAGAGLAGAAYVFAPVWLPRARPAARTPSSVRNANELDALVQRARELINTADLLAAKSQLDRARLLDANDSRLLVETSRWHMQTAELAWWRARMYAGADGAPAQLAREELKTALGLADATLRRAESLGELAAPLRWAGPALRRMEGRLNEAREQTAALAVGGTSPPEYLQAAFAVASGSVDWTLTAQQLDKAASGETALGPGRFALIFVLGSGGRLDDAHAWLNATTRQPTTEPLFRELEGFLERTATADAGGTDTVAQSDASTPEAGTAATGDFRHQLTEASEALRAGGLSRAARLFRAVLDTVPDNTEALSGLADVARARNDVTTASATYERVLERNPNYLPALMSLADLKWQNGDRQGASRYYRRVVEHAGPTSSYGARATQRLRELEMSAGLEPGADAARPTAPRADAIGDRLSTKDDASTTTAKPTRDAGTEPSGRNSRPSQVNRRSPTDFVP